jgi:hypothetical protein
MGMVPVRNTHRLVFTAGRRASDDVAGSLDKTGVDEAWMGFIDFLVGHAIRSLVADEPSETESSP